MLLGPDGEAVGSVSGGCVEGAVYELSGEVVSSGVPVLERYGVSDDDAFAVGLTCGGILDVFVERVDPQSFPELDAIAADIDAGRPVAVCTVIEHPDPAFVGRRLVVRPEGGPGEDGVGLGGPGSPPAPGLLRVTSLPQAVSPVLPEAASPGEAAGDGAVAPSGAPDAEVTSQAEAMAAEATSSEAVAERLSPPADRKVTPASSLGSERIDAAVTDDARGLLAAGRSETLTYGPDGERRGEGMRVFVAAYAPKPRMLVFGAIDFAAAVARVGVFLGYHVTVCDARPVFATRSRFAEADEVVVEWPHRYLAAEAEAGRIDARTVLAVLTHDPKFDVPLLEVALRLPEVAYIGAMGSRRTHDDRLHRLAEAGLTPQELGRLSSPIGLDLGARTPEETAVSIAAEIIALRWGGEGVRLGERDGPIHHSAGT